MIHRVSAIGSRAFSGVSILNRPAGGGGGGETFSPIHTVVRRQSKGSDFSAMLILWPRPLRRLRGGR